MTRRRYRDATFPPKLWSVKDNVKNKTSRTSNNLEGWHTKCNVLLKSGNRPFYVVVQQFQLDERSANVEILHVVQGVPPSKRSKKVIAYEEKKI